MPTSSHAVAMATRRHASEAPLKRGCLVSRAAWPAPREAPRSQTRHVAARGGGHDAGGGWARRRGGTLARRRRRLREDRRPAPCLSPG